MLCLAVALTQEVNPFPQDGWFASQYRLFLRNPGADNLTPIAAPAFLYFANHVLAKMLGLGLEAEFYIGCLVQNIAVFLGGVFLYRAHRLLGLGIPGLLVSALVVVFIESTLVAQAFWSENATLFLMCVACFCSVRIAVGVDDEQRSLLWWSLVLGLSLGLSVITRVVPIVLVPGLIWLFYRRLDRHRARLASTTLTVCVLALVLGAMSANLWRFDRFELSNSTGRHLWQNITPWADEMLAGSAEYQLLKRTDPAIAGKKWWEVQNGSVPGLEHLSREELLRLLSWQAITSHPWRYFRTGIENTLLLLRSKPPWRLGTFVRTSLNPLARSSMLPPLLAPFPKLEEWFRLVHGGISAVWPLFTYGVLLAWIMTALIRRWGRSRRGSVTSSPGMEGSPSAKVQEATTMVGSFLVFALLVPLWVTCQIELPTGRYLLPYLPVLALLASTTLFAWGRCER